MRCEDQHHDQHPFEQKRQLRGKRLKTERAIGVAGGNGWAGTEAMVDLGVAAKAPQVYVALHFRRGRLQCGRCEVVCDFNYVPGLKLAILPLPATNETF
ncbi:MAG: hypothetical protein NVSMB42_05560 [Herpetosiphon sp.]